MPVNPLVKPIEEGAPLVVLAPHLDDAALSCGALMIHASRHTSVTVVTFFTEAGQRPYTLSARRYLYQAGVHDAQALYEQRRAEDLAALEPLGIKCVHAGLTEALFRRRPGPSRRKRLAWLIPELAHTYPIYRTHVISGQIAPDDRDTLRAARAVVRQETAQGPCLVLAPLGVGGHVDHVLVRSAAASSGRAVIYYSDFPYNQRNPLQEAFVRRNGLVETKWFEFAEAKARLVQAYRSQMWSLFQDGRIPPAPEMFFSPAAYPAADSAIQMRLWNGVEQVTMTRIRSAPAAALHARPRAGRPAVVAAVVGGVTLLIRLALRVRGFDLFGDETIYTSVGRSVISGGFPRFEGQAFFLHGPGFFYLEAGWARLVGNPPGLMAWVYEMRTLNALLAGVTAVILVLLATRASCLRAGAVTGLLFALNPFCIRQNDRVLLETALMFWVLLGYLVFTSLIGRVPSRRDWPCAVGAGLLFGCALLTKDEGALLTVVPLLAAVALGWGPRRALTLLTVGTTVAVYAVYVAVVVSNGQFSGLWVAKTSGLQRMLGLVQVTGFHSAQGGSLSSRLIAEFGSFGTTYIFLALAAPALVVLLRRGGRPQRMLGLLYCAAGLTLGYALAFGTLEEQELYLLIVPSLLIIPVAATLLFERRRFSRSARRSRRIPSAAVIIAALMLTFGLNIFTCVQWWREPDEAIVRLLQYVPAHIPVGTTVINPTATLSPPQSDITQEALPPRYNVDPWLTPGARSRDHVRYVVVEWGLIGDGYSKISSSEILSVVRHGRQVFSALGRTYGQVTLYELPLPAEPVTGRQ